MQSIAFLPHKIVSGKFDAAFYQEIILSSWIFRRETASGFYPWGNVEGRLSGKLVGIGVYFSKSVQEELFVHYSPE